MKKSTIIGGGIFAAAVYAAAGFAYAKKRPAGAVREGTGKVVALWPLVMWNDRKNAKVKAGGATLEAAAKGAMAGTVAGVKV